MVAAETVWERKSAYVSRKRMWRTPPEPSSEGNEHLCSTIRGILPRLHHLRLRLNHICPNLFDPNYQFPDPGWSVMTKFMAPHLKTMIINLRPLP